MASKKKYNPDDVERWVTVRGARIPIMKDGSFGVGTKDDIDDEERAMDLVDSKDYIGDAGLKKGVEDNLKSSGYDLGSRMKVESAEITRWDGKSDYGYVEATYKLYGGDYGKNGQSFTEEMRVPVRKSSTTSRNARYDTSRATKKNGATAEDIARDKETFRKAKEQEAKVKTRKQTGKQAIRDAKAALKQYGFSARLYGYKDFDKLNEIYSKLSRLYPSQISQEDYETIYNLFKDNGQYNRFFEIRNYHLRKKKK